MAKYKKIKCPRCKRRFSMAAKTIGTKMAAFRRAAQPLSRTAVRTLALRLRFFSPAAAKPAGPASRCRKNLSAIGQGLPTVWSNAATCARYCCKILTTLSLPAWSILVPIVLAAPLATLAMLSLNRR